MNGVLRSLRFGHPDESGVPGLRVASGGTLETLTQAAAVRQALRLLLTTRPGERVMRPEYGCRLHELVFALADETTAGLAMHYVQSAVRRWEPRVEVSSVDARWDAAQPTLLQIRLEYRFRRSNARDTLSWEMEFPTEV